MWEDEWKRDLKYDVVRTASGDNHNMLDLVASFKSLDVAKLFMSNARDYVHSPFDWKGEGEMWDIIYRGSAFILFNDPAVNSLIMKADDYPAGTTKEMLAKRFIKAGQFDYALPETWVRGIVNRLRVEFFEKWSREQLYRIIIGGVVWFYPEGSSGRIFGKPAALTAEAIDCLTKNVEIDDES